MGTKPWNLKIRFYLASIIVFLIGTSSSIGIYLTAREIPESVFYDYEHSKRFRHEMEAAGGKLNMLLYEMAKEFQGLWEGRTLAFTVAVITVIVSGMLLFIAIRLDSQK